MMFARRRKQTPGINSLTYTPPLSTTTDSTGAHTIYSRRGKRRARSVNVIVVLQIFFAMHDTQPDARVRDRDRGGGGDNQI